MYPKFKPPFLIATVLGVASGLMLLGCGSDNSIKKEDPAVTAKRVDTAKQMREIFNKCNGNYDALSDEDKQKINAITGSEAQTKEAFGHMGGGGGASAPAG